MDRLTKRDENGVADLTGNFDAEKIYNFLRDNLSVLDALAFQGILTRLAKYEDTGAAPEEFHDLKEREWISVEKRLPHKNELDDTEYDVLIYDGANVANVIYCLTQESGFGYWKPTRDYQTSPVVEYEWIPITGVTHWMPFIELSDE